MSKATESLCDGGLTEANSKVLVDEFEAHCPPTLKGFSAADVTALRESLHCSQAMFAHYLHTSAVTVRKWEQGETRPTGPALKLLNLLADKGLQAIV